MSNILVETEHSCFCYLLCSRSLWSLSLDIKVNSDSVCKFSVNHSFLMRRPSFLCVLFPLALLNSVVFVFRGFAHVLSFRQVPLGLLLSLIGQVLSIHFFKLARKLVDIISASVDALDYPHVNLRCDAALNCLINMVLNGFLTNEFLHDCRFLVDH